MKFMARFSGVKVRENVYGYVSDPNKAKSFNELYMERYAVSLPQKTVGIDLLNQFNLKSEDVKSESIKFIDSNPPIEIPEEIARESNLFNSVSFIDVQVSERMLNKLVKIIYDDCEKIFKYKLYKEDVIAFWKENNYSLLILDEKDQETKLMMEKRIEESYKLYLQKKEEDEAKKYKDEEDRFLYIEERTKWIEENGDQYLKDCIEMDYSCNKEYVKQRAGIELKGFELDYKKNCEWDDRINPSRKAIEELKKIKTEHPELNSQIVWLKTTPKFDDDNQDFYEAYPCEAILIDNYLDKNILVMEIRF